MANDRPNTYSRCRSCNAHLNKQVLKKQTETIDQRNKANGKTDKKLLTPLNKVTQSYPELSCPNCGQIIEASTVKRIFQ